MISNIFIQLKSFIRTAHDGELIGWGTTGKHPQMQPHAVKGCLPGTNIGFVVYVQFMPLVWRHPHIIICLERKSGSISLPRGHKSKQHLGWFLLLYIVEGCTSSTVHHHKENSSHWGHAWSMDPSSRSTRSRNALPSMTAPVGRLTLKLFIF